MERPPGSLGGADRILVVRLGAVGDVLRVLPAVRRMRAALPSAHLAWIVEPLSQSLLEGHPDLDEVIPFPRRDLRPDPAHPIRWAHAFRELGDRLRRGRYSVAIDFQSSLKSGLVTARSGAPRRVGFRPSETREMSFLFTNEWVSLSSPWLNRVDRNLEVAAALGIADGPAAPSLPERPEEGREAEAMLAAIAPAGARILLSPGVSRRQRWKAWPATHYAALARALEAAAGIRPIVAWGPGEETLARSVCDAAQGAAILAPPTRLRALAALLRRADLFIGADTGPMHLAWVVGCRVIALFGPTDPRLNAPRGRDDVVLHAPDQRMEDLSPETVAGTVVGALARAAATAPSGPPPVAPAAARGAAGGP